jgi:alcohol dehydrogenase (cytochrome c)
MRAALLVSVIASWSGSVWGQGVTFDRILKASQEPQNWLTYSGSVNGQRHTLLNQITPANVKNLELKWIWQAKSTEKFETTALVVDGTMYTIQATNDVVAMDAATGRLYWTYAYPIAPEARACCGRVNRGLAILGDTLFIGTLDAHVVAINAKTGRPVWNTEIAKASEGYAITHAPLIVKDKVIVGTAGGDTGIRAFIAALDVKTGKEVWRFYNIPAPGEFGNDTWAGDSWKKGGAAVWNTGSYDPDLNLTYWGTGNPWPDTDGSVRLGDNLYSDCVLALDPDTGKLKWYYQFTPHDVMDYDSTQVAVLADMPWTDKNGQTRTRKVMMWGNRNGVYYTLDRTTGEFLVGKPFTTTNWLTGFDEKGRPMRDPTKDASPQGTVIMPTVLGGTNWYPPSYSPSTGLFYLSAWENTGTMRVSGGGRGAAFGGPNPMAQVNLFTNTKRESDGIGVVRAIDPHTGEKKWEFKMADITWAGVLTTASDLLFTGGREGYFFALNARNGELLWKASVGGQVNSGPMSYSVNGKQYIAVAAGSALFVYGLREVYPDLPNQQR